MDISHTLNLPPVYGNNDIKQSNTTSTVKTVSFIKDTPTLRDNKYSSISSSATITTDDESGISNLISRKKSNLGSIWRGSIGRNKTLKRLLDTKTVGFAGGVTLLINGILGPGLIPTPEQYSESGFLIPTLVFLFFTIISTLCATFIIEAMQTIPGNKHFQGTVEFSTLINFYFGKKMHFIGQVILFLAIQSTNISSIIYSAQTMDNFIINVFKKSCGVALNYHSMNDTIPDETIKFHCVDKLAEENSPFGDQYMLITLGFIVTFICIFPVGFMKLQDNINLQIISFTVTVTIFIIWIIMFFIHGINTDIVSFIGDNQSQVVGVVMFNFAFITTIPSWINMKKKEVSVQKSLWTSTITSVILYILIGYTAALSADSKGTLNLLSHVGSINLFGRITTYIFSIAILMVSIPVFSIIVRDNLVQNNICGNKTATFFSHVFPWICVLPFQTGTLINSVINWTSLLFVSTANFIIPLIIYLKCTKFNKKYTKDKYLSLRQRSILKCVHKSSNTIQGFIDKYPSVGKKTEKIEILENIDNNIEKIKDDKEETVENEEIETIEINESDNKDIDTEVIAKPEKTVNNTDRLSDSSLTEINRNEAYSELKNIDSRNEYKTKVYDEDINEKKYNSNYLSPYSTTTEQKVKTHGRNVSFSNEQQYQEEDKDKVSIPIEKRKNTYSLPTHPLFISNVFEGIPSWVPVKPNTLAKICLGLVSFITVFVICLNIYQLF